MTKKLTKWFVFGVVIALLPLLFRLICLFIMGVAPTFVAVTSQGELLLISVGMGAAAIGEIVACDTNNKIFLIISVGSCVVLLILSALMFAFISQSSLPSPKVDVNLVSKISLYLYAFSFISSANCVYLSGE